MLRTLRPILILSSLLTVSLAKATTPVSGWWYMAGEEKGTKFQYLVERRADGSFTAKIRTYRECRIAEPWDETGRWKYSDGTLYNETESVGGKSVDSTSEKYQDSFTITVIDDDHIRMVDNELTTVFDARRVEASYQLPPPPGCGEI